PAYRIGAGTRNGFGKIKIVADQSKSVCWNLKEENQLKAYLKKSRSLNDDIPDWDNIQIINNGDDLEGWQDFSVRLKAKDFFSFSAGFGDEEADNKPKKERYFEWSSGKPKLIEKDYTLL